MKEKKINHHFDHFKLDLSLIEQSSNELPTALALGLRNIHSTYTIEGCCLSIIDFTEILLEHLSFFCLSQYLVCLDKDIILGHKKTDNFILSNIDRLSFGTTLRIFREVSSILYKEEKMGLLYDVIKNFQTNKKLFNALDLIIKYRNKVAHQKFKFNESNVKTDGKKIVANFQKLLLAIAPLRELMLISPIQAIDKERYCCNLYRGSGIKPLYIMIDIKNTGNEEIIIDNTLLFNERLNDYVKLYPFFVPSLDNTEDKKTLYFTHLKGVVAELIDVFGTGVNVKSKEIGCTYLQHLNILSVDYKYQKQSYLKGHNLLIEKQTSKFFISSLDGDLTTEIYLKVKKIKASSNSKNTDINVDEGHEGDFIRFDYHDAPLYPISDKLFNIKAIDENNNLLPVKYSIHNDGFRDFSIGLGETLSFDESKEVMVTFFEPMLMHDIQDSGNDYYEINFNIPVESIEVFFHFPEEVIPQKDFKLNWLGNIEGHSYIKQREIICKDDRHCIYFRLERPPLEETIITEFSVVKKTTQIEIEDRSLDSFRAGLKIYNLLKDAECRWEIENNEDELILIKKIS